MNQIVDKSNMFNSIWEFADNIEDAFSLGNNIELKYTQEWNGDGVALGKEIDIEQANLFFNWLCLSWY